MSIRVAVNGLGRIGKMFLKNAIINPEIEIVAVNDLYDTEILSHLLQYDSLYGKYENEVVASGNNIVIDGQDIRAFSETDITRLPWRELDIDIVVDSTGKNKDRKILEKHLESGARKVVVSSPAIDPDVTIVLGVNTEAYNKNEHNIISNASCTTNCLAPLIKVIKENFGFKKGMMTTIHSYNQDQRLHDFPNKDYRRARAGALSMIPTSTGATKAVTRIFPDIKGKITGMSVRVPVPNVSLIDLVAHVEENKGIKKDDVNDAFRKASEGMLKGILDISSEPLVSVDYLGNTFSSTVDGLCTDVCEDMIKVISWYDNECGYSKRLTELVMLVGRLL